MKTVSLKSSINRIILLTFFSVGALVYVLLLGTAEVQRNFDRATTLRDLQINLARQSELILLTFLLPEQRAGQEPLIERFKSEEHLSQAKVLQSKTEVPREFAECNTQSTCESKNGDFSAVITPIKEGETLYGYLFKVKENGSAHLNKDLLGNFMFILAILFVAFLALAISIAKVLSRDVPQSLNRLASWVEDVLADRNSNRSPNLPIREFRNLGERIAEIIERQEHEKEQALIGTLSSGIIHDIRTPLHTIFFATELVKKNESPEKRTKYLDDLYKACSARLPVVFQIIESTLDGNRKINLVLKNQDILGTIAQAIQINRDLAIQHDVNVSINTDQKEIVFPHDPVQLQRVFVNLIKNAIESTFETPIRLGEGHKVGVYVEDVGADGLLISVEDTGPGIQGNRQRIFRFMYSNKTRGTGLGLLVTKKIVEAHEGNVAVEDSIHLGGAKMIIRLPRLEPKECARIYLNQVEAGL